MQELVRRQLLVNSELTEYTLDVDELVIRHQRIPVVSYCFEWSPGMLKEAALLTLELCIRLAEKELTLQDGHPWNILFDGNHPVFVDLGSITPVRPDILWAPYQQFCNFFLFPLYLYSANCDRLARWLLRDYLYGITDGDVLTALPFSFKLFHPGRTLKIWGPMVLSKVLNHLPQQLRNQFLSFAKTSQFQLQSSRDFESNFWNRYAKTSKRSNWVVRAANGLVIIGPPMQTTSRQISPRESGI